MTIVNIDIADKATLDSVDAKIGDNSDYTSSSSLFGKINYIGNNLASVKTVQRGVVDSVYKTNLTSISLPRTVSLNIPTNQVGAITIMEVKFGNSEISSDQYSFNASTNELTVNYNSGSTTNHLNIYYKYRNDDDCISCNLPTSINPDKSLVLLNSMFSTASESSMGSILYNLTSSSVIIKPYVGYYDTLNTITSYQIVEFY